MLPAAARLGRSRADHRPGAHAFGRRPADLRCRQPGPIPSWPAPRLALEHGRPWQASRLIAVVLADSARRTPDALMLAATAASRWGGWPEVTRLLDGQPWLDTRLRRPRPAAAGPRRAGAGRRLGRAGHALAAPASSIDSVEGERLVLLATALERLARPRQRRQPPTPGPRDRLPAIAGWLRIRAAAVDRRQRRARGALRRRRRPAGARADRLERGRRPPRHRRPRGRGRALRRRSAPGPPRSGSGLAASPDSANGARASAATSWPSSPRAGARARRATRSRLLDSAFAPLTPAEELEVGRAAATRRQLHPRGRGVRARLRRRSRHARGSLRLRHRADPARAATPRPRGSSPWCSRRASSPRRRPTSAPVRWCARASRGRGRRRSSACSAPTRATPRPRRSALFLLGDLASDDRADARGPRLLPADRHPLPQQPLRARRPRSGRR